VWLISGTPTVTGANTSTAYYTFPVTLVSSAGAAFTNNHSLLFGQISVATNAVTSATTSDGTATLSTSTLTTGTLTVSTSGVFNATSYTFGTGAAEALKTALLISSGDITFDTSVVISGASSGVTTFGEFGGINTAGDSANITTSGSDARIYTSGANADILTIDASASIRSTNFAAYATTGATLKTSAGIEIATFGVSGQNFSILSGTALTFNNTSFTYGTGAASAHVTALGLPAANTIATLAGSETLTNKTLTSPAINSATIGTAATFNATTYTFGTGAAAALNTALGTTRVMRTTLATRTSGTILVDDTLVLPVVSGVTYRVKVHTLTKNSTATVGMVLRIDHPGITASGSDTVGHFTNGGGNSTITPSTSTSLTNSVNQNGQNLSTISEVILTPNASGDVKVMWGARVPAGAETAGLNIGSYLEVTKIS
jgi:uncharacterized protein YaiE (UPF0345 family)